MNTPGPQSSEQPDALLGAMIDRLDAAEADGLIEVLERDAEASDRLKAYARQKRQLRRSANALEHEGNPRTDTLARRLAGRLKVVRTSRWVGVLATAAVFGWAMGEISDRIVAPPFYYGFETMDARVVEEAPARHIELTAAQASQGRLADWIGRRVIVPDLSAQDLTFTGARLVDVGEIKLVGLVYDGPGGELVLCQSPDLDGLAEAPELIRTTKVQAAYWSDGRRTFVLMAQLERSDIGSLMTEFSRQTAMRQAPNRLG